ncbi:MAG: hypothetical protein GTN40_00855 [Candidatus Aenigmarchaeota archaeon]|nr:hypothetical protein [Candidatus Aenigmarchaeota archaeon]
MKGISAIIAIILILMIVVALAALAYTWFTGIFAGLTGGAETAVEATTTAMGVNFRIETAKNVTDDVSVTIRNIGTSTINVSKMTAYVDDEKEEITDIADSILDYGETTTFFVNNTVEPNGKKLKIVAVTGLEQTATIT